MYFAQDKNYKLKDFCGVGDGTHTSISRQTDGVMYLTSKNFKPNGLDLTKIDYISDADYEKHFEKAKTALVKPMVGDVVFGIIGTIGTPYVVRKGDKFGISSSVGILRPGKEIDPQFLYYYMTSSLFQMAVDGMKSGAAQGFLSLEIIKNLPLLKVELKIQKNIAAILSTYDELIENNKRRIILLESIAENIYREWFMRFRFPNYKTTEFKKGVPKNWSYGKANLFFDHVKGKSYKSNEVVEVDENSMPFITLKSFNRGGGYRGDGLKSYSGKYNDKQVVFDGDVVMAVTDMTQNREVVGRVARIPDVGDKGAVISLDVIKLIPKTISSTYLYSYMKYSGFGHFIKSFANGANVLHLKPDLVTQQVIVVPTEDLRKKYEALVEPINEQTGILTKEISNLEKTRKNLLPRLISGQFSVGDLDIKFPPSMQEENVA